MVEPTNVEAKKPTRQRIKEASAELFKDGGKVARAAFWAVTGIYSETLRIEGILRGVDGRVKGVEGKVGAAEKTITQITEKQTSQGKDIDEAKLVASNAKGAAADAKTEVGELGKKVAAVEEANKKQDTKIEELTTGWGRVDKILAALGGENIRETIAGLVQEAVQKLGLGAPVVVPTSADPEVARLAEELAALRSAVEPAITFAEVCAEDLSAGVLNAQTEEALRTGDFTKVLKGFDPNEIRATIGKIAEDEHSDVKDTAQTIDVEGSPVAQAFSRAVVTWVIENHATAAPDVFKEVCLEALEAIGGNEGFAGAFEELIASGGAIAKTASETRDRVSAESTTW